MSYICKDCENNNHGWCEYKKINGLKKLGLVKCNGYTNEDLTILRLEKINDEYGENLIITIRGEATFIPVETIKGFLNDSKAKNIIVSLPRG